MRSRDSWKNDAAGLTLAPGCGTEIGAPGYDPFGPEGANFNLVIGNDAIDPVSGSVPHRAYLCEVRRAGGESR